MRRHLSWALLLTMGCEDPDPWSDTVSTGALSYEISASTSVFLEVRVHLATTESDVDCDQLYATPEVEILADAPNVDLTYYYEPQMNQGDTVLRGLDQGRSVQPGDTKNLAADPAGGCFTEMGIELTGDGSEIAQFELSIRGAQASPTSPHPGEGIAFTLDVVER